ncbi:hypothetical protein [Maricaulis sp.]|uniref:hypothetical protein n=1 Tax=Maricaulis sp. TaxID=1486257 RepID=UPI002626B626|nr:hypothetical protein [Maricaulis sp.]
MTGENKQSKKRRSPFVTMFGVLGILMAIAALISLIQRWTGIEITIEVAADAIDLYREMMAQFKWAMFDWWTPVKLPFGLAISMPMWGMDLLAVWVLSVTAMIRSHSVFERPDTGILVSMVVLGPLGLVLDLITSADYFRDSLYDVMHADIHDGKAMNYRNEVNSYQKIRANIKESHRFLRIIEGWFQAFTPFIAVAVFFIWNAIQL